MIDWRVVISLSNSQQDVQNMPDGLEVVWEIWGIIIVQ